jgi:NAD(P)-dependent dehydrogenase (short-subunit alcohol dehydrogenase family)
MKTVLFLCTGNYYRSRFAEIFFNWHAEKLEIPWRADSRGLDLDPLNPGKMSRYTVSRLVLQEIPVEQYQRNPKDLDLADLKAAHHVVEGLTKTAALELAGQGIRVNAVAPGAIATHMIDRFAGEEGTDNRKRLAALHPMGRIGESKEIAAAVLYLASDAASFTTGISLPVDGGYLTK